jgi:FkbH-like protein
MTQDKNEVQPVKCVVWDLDNTLWNGILLEDEAVHLRPESLEVLRTLDRRGILHSVASRNDSRAAMAKLREFGLEEYFLYPQINWNSKASSIECIAKQLNFAMDAMAFVDDQSFERDEVAFSLPSVLCIDGRELASIPDHHRLHPRFITEDSRLRRAMYSSDILREESEKEFVGSKESFLEGLGMVFTVAAAGEGDLQRAEELMVRTHQLNSTGYAYSYDELQALRRSPDHLLLMATLEDRYGTYGKIGLALVERNQAVWTIKLLLMSCRVIARGVGSVLLSHIMNLARAAGVRLQSEFVSNDRNRMMYITYKFAGFREVRKDGAMSVLENDLTNIQPFPPFMQVRIL